MPEKIKREWYELKTLMRSVPPMAVALLTATVFTMNLLANKSIFLPVSWMALDCGIVISWLAFLIMDVVTKHFGPKASTKISVLACAINLLTCLIFFVASAIPSNAADYTAFNGIFGGTWFILLGSTVAFLASAVLNNVLNFTISRAFKRNPNGKTAYAVSVYVSTFAGQFFDNFIFSLIVFVGFAPIYWNGFHWTVLQCAACALTGAVAELIMEIIFSPIGYRITKKWRENAVGRAYLEYMGKGE